MDRYVEAANAWNLKALADFSQKPKAGSANGPDNGADGTGSATDVTESSEPQTAGSDEAGSSSQPAERSVEVPEATDSQPQLLEPGRSHACNKNGCRTNGAHPGSDVGAGLVESDKADSTGSNKHSEAAAGNVKVKKKSRVVALLSRIRGRRRQHSRQPSNVLPSADQHEASPTPKMPPQDRAEISAGADDPAQAGTSSAGAASLSLSASDMSNVDRGDVGKPSQPGSESAAVVDWSQLNSSMMHSLHTVISDMITAAIAKVLCKKTFRIH